MNDVQQRFSAWIAEDRDPTEGGVGERLLMDQSPEIDALFSDMAGRVLASALLTGDLHGALKIGLRATFGLASDFREAEYARELREDG